MQSLNFLLPMSCTCIVKPKNIGTINERLTVWFLHTIQAKLFVTGPGASDQLVLERAVLKQIVVMLSSTCDGISNRKSGLTPKGLDETACGTLQDTMHSVRAHSDPAEICYGTMHLGDCTFKYFACWGRGPVKWRLCFRNAMRQWHVVRKYWHIISLWQKARFLGSLKMTRKVAHPNRHACFVLVGSVFVVYSSPDDVVRIVPKF